MLITRKIGKTMDATMAPTPSASFHFLNKHHWIFEPHLPDVQKNGAL
jgi:hypothetical protein